MTDILDKPRARATLTIAVSAGVEAKLVIVNATGSPVYLERVHAALGDALENDLFGIVDLDDPARPRLDYTGMLAKRAPPTLDDFVRLEPGQAIEARVRLDRFYAFAKGRHAYAATYAAFHPLPDRPGIWQLVSNEARFVFRARG